MKIFACFPSKYLKAADLCDRNVTVVMSHVGLEELSSKKGTDLCPILYFNGLPKGMVLNVTNSQTIADAYGDETEAWSGKPIVLFSAMVAYGNKVGPAIRLKIPPPRQGGPTSRERQTAVIAASADPSTAAEAIIDNWTQTNANRMRNAMRSHMEKPQHDADGVIWDETAERMPTEQEKAELLRESLARANAALDERREVRGASQPGGDGLDIPTFLQRAKPQPTTIPEHDYGRDSWIEFMQAAE